MRSRAMDRIAVTEHFDLGASEHASEAAVMQAPVICQLCGQGFLDDKGLWAEYRKRLIYDVGRRVNVPLRPVEKRRVVGNCMHDLLC